MKKLEFETSKGRFLVVDFKDEYSGIHQLTELGYGFLCVLKEITEEQASEIVDDYILEIYEIVGYNSIESLHSLLKSKGIYLFENPIDLDEQLDCNCDICYQQLEDAFDEAEQKTFYNPYIFKL